MKSLYLECYSGISGDMTVASLLDLGANKEQLLSTLKELKIDDDYDIKISKVKKFDTIASDFDVILKKEYYDDRHLNDVLNIIDRLSNTDVKVLAKKIVNIVAESESKAHGINKEEVNFHGRGAVDSIIDIVSTAFCIVNLNIKNVYVSTLYEGTGVVHLPHKDLNVPVPAVVNIINKYNIDIKITNNIGEQITPTGAAIVAALKNKDKLPDEYMIEKTGIGAGKKYPDRASVVKAMIIK